jgi:hypothetical protein
MSETKQGGIDRRSGKDRRRTHSLDYFLNNGVEKRGWKERRSPVEQRSGWFRVSNPVSVPETSHSVPFRLWFSSLCRIHEEEYRES